MKTIGLVAAAVFLMFLFISAGEIPPRFNVLKGPYLGQEPPGRTPKIFAPGIISTGLHTKDISMSPGCDEIYFSVNDVGLAAIFETRLENGRWTEPAIAAFSGRGFFDFEPQMSLDGRELFFLSNRPPAGGKPRGGCQHIWTATRTAEGWSEPRLLPASLCQEDREYSVSVTKDDTLYFTRSKSNGPARIYRSELENGRYREPAVVSLAVPNDAELFNAFVSPDEDFLIACGLGIESSNIDEDYYICFRSSDGRWGRLIKFGLEVNAPGDHAGSAYVSPDGRYLFFSSSRKDPDRPPFKSGTTLRNIFVSKSTPGFGSSAIYWVSSNIIEELRPKEDAPARPTNRPSAAHPSPEVNGSRSGRV